MISGLFFIIDQNHLNLFFQFHLEWRHLFKTTSVKIILRILIGLPFVSSIYCQNVDKNEVPTYDTEIIIKNKAAYSAHFIQGLKVLGYQKIELIDSLLIIDNKDTVLFSGTPKIGEDRVYTGKQGKLYHVASKISTNFSKQIIDHAFDLFIIHFNISLK